MEDQKTLSLDKANSSTMFSMSQNALNLINEGKETEAHSKFPLEYHFIKKYYTANIDELIQLLNRKLEVF
ncbi:MAG: hypothetical protein ABI723_11030 [Bacteroidia bacterium]